MLLGWVEAYDVSIGIGYCFIARLNLPLPSPFSRFDCRQKRESYVVSFFLETFVRSVTHHGVNQPVCWYICQAVILLMCIGSLSAKMTANVLPKTVIEFNIFWESDG